MTKVFSCCVVISFLMILPAAIAAQGCVSFNGTYTGTCTDINGDSSSGHYVRFNAIASDGEPGNGTLTTTTPGSCTLVFVDAWSGQDIRDVHPSESGSYQVGQTLTTSVTSILNGTPVISSIATKTTRWENNNKEFVVETRTATKLGPPTDDRVETIRYSLKDKWLDVKTTWVMGQYKSGTTCTLKRE